MLLRLIEGSPEQEEVWVPFPFGVMSQGNYFLRNSLKESLILRNSEFIKVLDIYLLPC